MSHATKFHICSSFFPFQNFDCQPTLITLHRRQQAMVFRVVIILFLLLILSPLDSHSFTVNTRILHQGTCTTARPRQLVESTKEKKVDSLDQSTCENVDLTSFGSLDSILEKARQREGIHLRYKVQAIWDTPVLRIERPYPFLKSSIALTVGDAGLSAIALSIGAKGFALGYILGKISAGPFREIFRPNWQVLSFLMPLWPVIWAIGLDQLV